MDVPSTSNNPKNNKNPRCVSLSTHTTRTRYVPSFSFHQPDKRLCIRTSEECETLRRTPLRHCKGKQATAITHPTNIPSAQVHDDDSEYVQLEDNEQMHIFDESIERAFAHESITQQSPGITIPEPTSPHQLNDIQTNNSSSDKCTSLPTQRTTTTALSSTTTIEMMKRCNRSLMTVLRWDRLFSFFCVSGTSRFTYAQYEILEAAIRTCSNDSERLKTFKTIRSTQWNFMRVILFARSEVRYVNTNAHRSHRRKIQKTVSTISNEEKDPRDCARIILPSEWAKLDILTLHIYRSIFGDLSKQSQRLCIEQSPLVSENYRSRYVSGRCSLWASFRGTVTPTSLNDSVTLTCTSIQYIRDNQFQNDRWVSSFKVDTNETSFNGRVGPMWCVVGEKGCTGASSETVSGLTSEEMKIFVKMKKATHSFGSLHLLHSTVECSAAASENNYETGTGDTGRTSRCGASRSCNKPDKFGTSVSPVYSNIFLFPGDICTIIRPSSDMTSSFLCVMISSFLWREDGKIAERCIWISKTAAAFDNDIATSSSAIPVSFWCGMAKMPEITNGFTPSSALCSNRYSSNQGILEDGSRYVIYRFILYTDGFNQKKSLSDKRSVCGCYLMPAGQPHTCRASSISARVVTLGAHGQDPNELLEYIVDDILEGVTSGFDSFDPYGKKVKVFLDPVAIIGDYPAVSSSTDVAGHTADAFCSFCAVRKRKGGQHPQILFTNKLHSRRASLTRFDERMKIIRSERPPPAVKKHLGISCDDEDEASQLIAVRLSNELSKRIREVKRNNEGHNIVDVTFDSHLSAAAVPDHLFKGLISNVLTVCFGFLPNDEQRRRVDRMICLHIQENHVPRIDTVLSWAKNGKYIGLNNLTTSALFCVILFAATIFSDLNVRQSTSTSDEIPCPYHLPAKLQSIIGLMYWWPNVNSDTMSDFTYVSGQNDKKPVEYYADIARLVEEYIDSIKDYYIRGGRQREILDKPNAHRLLELVHHTLPMYKHCLNVSELVLEMVHRTFKEWLDRNTHHDAHITAIEVAAARDWGNRLYCLYMTWKYGTAEEKAAAEFGLLRLCFGEQVLQSCKEVIFESGIIDSFRDQLQSALRDPVLSQAKGSSVKTLLPVERLSWAAAGELKSDELSPRCIKGMCMIRQVLVEGREENTSIKLNCFRVAQLLRQEVFSAPKRTNSFNNIRPNDFISALVTGDEKAPYLSAACSKVGKKVFYKVLGIVKSCDNKIWLLVQSVIKMPGKNKYGLSEGGRQQDDVQVLPLTLSTRRVASVHYCTEECNLVSSGTNMCILHDTSANYFRILSAKEGYPPHMG